MTLPGVYSVIVPLPSVVVVVVVVSETCAHANGAAIIRAKLSTNESDGKSSAVALANLGSRRRTACSSQGLEKLDG